MSHWSCIVRSKGACQCHVTLVLTVWHVTTSTWQKQSRNNERLVTACVTQSWSDAREWWWEKQRKTRNIIWPQLSDFYFTSTITVILKLVLTFARVKTKLHHAMPGLESSCSQNRVDYYEWGLYLNAMPIIFVKFKSSSQHQKWLFSTKSPHEESKTWPIMIFRAGTFH